MVVICRYSYLIRFQAYYFKSSGRKFEEVFQGFKIIRKGKGMKKIWAVLVVVGFLIIGCGNEEKKEVTGKEGKKAPGSVEETQSTSSGRIAEKTDELKRATVEMANAIQERTSPVVEKTKEAAIDLIETIHEKTEPAVKTTKALVATVKEKSTPVIIATIETTTDLTQKATKAVQDIGTHGIAKESPIVVILKNKKGEITMPHKKHSDLFDCQTCHGENEPGSFSLNKAIGHKLCKGCHKEKASGPTKCSGCHLKTVTKAVEGC